MHLQDLSFKIEYYIKKIDFSTNSASIEKIVFSVKKSLKNYFRKVILHKIILVLVALKRIFDSVKHTPRKNYISEENI